MFLVGIWSHHTASKGVAFNEWPTLAEWAAVSTALRNIGNG